MVAGVGRALDAIERFRFDDEVLDVLREHRVVDEPTLEWLAGYRFTGDVWGYAEGETYFPYSPLLVVESTFAEAVLFEMMTGSNAPSSGRVYVAGTDIHRVKYRERDRLAIHYHQSYQVRRFRKLVPSVLLEPSPTSAPMVHLFDEPQFNLQDGYIGFMLDFFRKLRARGPARGVVPASDRGLASGNPRRNRRAVSAGGRWRRDAAARFRGTHRSGALSQLSGSGNDAGGGRALRRSQGRTRLNRLCNPAGLRS